MENEYLAHHGVKGMKWGVRRFQNEDGSLKAAGKARYGDAGSANKMKPSASDSKITRQVKNDYNTLDDRQFRAKYSTSKKTYAKRVAKSATGDPFRDRREKMTGSKVGSKAFDVGAKAESNQRVSEQLSRKAADVNAQRSTASRALTTAFLGRQGNVAYDKMRASGATKRGAMAAMALFGTKGASEYAESKYRNSKQGKRTYSKSLNRYYAD